MHRLWRLRGLLSHPCMDQEQGKILPLGSHGPYRKKEPRMAEDFIKWVDEDSIIKIVKNSYEYVEKYIDPRAPEGKEHVGYIVDRTGVEEFKKWIMKDVKLSPMAEVEKTLYWKGKRYDW